MAKPTKPEPVKLICGMIAADVQLFAQAEAMLAEAFGAADVAGETVGFDFTHYYDEEMGAPLYRRFLAFERRVSPDFLVEAKLRTNSIEEEFAELTGARPPRPVNLDPGYVEPSKLVLASMKNFSHRIYLGRGVYGEVTLMHQKGVWQAFPWTFPDFASGRYDAFLTSARQKLMAQRKDAE